MKKFLSGPTFLVPFLSVIAVLVWLPPIQKAIAQGVQRLSTFTGGAQITGISYPCTVSCYVLMTSGTFVINGATPVTVAAPNLTENSVVMFGLKTAGGTVSPNSPNLLTVTPGTGFTVGGTASDTSTYNYVIFN